MFATYIRKVKGKNTNSNLYLRKVKGKKVYNAFIIFMICKILGCRRCKGVLYYEYKHIMNTKYLGVVRCKGVLYYEYRAVTIIVKGYV